MTKTGAVIVATLMVFIVPQAFGESPQQAVRDSIQTRKEQREKKAAAETAENDRKRVAKQAQIKAEHTAWLAELPGIQKRLSGGSTTSYGLKQVKKDLEQLGKHIFIHDEGQPVDSLEQPEKRSPAMIKAAVQYLDSLESITPDHRTRDEIEAHDLVNHFILMETRSLGPEYSETKKTEVVQAIFKYATSRLQYESQRDGASTEKQGIAHYYSLTFDRSGWWLAQNPHPVAELLFLIFDHRSATLLKVSRAEVLNGVKDLVELVDLNPFGIEKMVGVPRAYFDRIKRVISEQENENE